MEASDNSTTAANRNRSGAKSPSWGKKMLVITAAAAGATFVAMSAIKGVSVALTPAPGSSLQPWQRWVLAILTIVACFLALMTLAIKLSIFCRQPRR